MRGIIFLTVCSLAALDVSAVGIFSQNDEAATPRRDDRISSIEELCQRLSDATDYAASATYSVLLPSADDEVVYDIDMQSASATDTIAPCSYLISWEVMTPSGKSEGFTSYADGSHFRYSDERLQEYHFENDSTPFLPAGGSVQRNARFATLLPAYLADDLRHITTDSTFTFTFRPDVTYRGIPAIKIDAKENIKGYVARELSYIFDAATGLPIRLAIESNPGAISEQTVTIEYSDADFTPVEDYTESALIALFPTVFEKFRSGNFRLENLPGTAMPRFSLTTLAGDRVTHHRGEPFNAPTIIAVIDPDAASAATTVADIRKAVYALPMAVDIIWAVKSRHPDTVTELMGSEPRDGEKILLGAGSIIRDCGITAFPAIIFAGSDGIIKSVHIGANKNLPEIVMQMTALL